MALAWLLRARAGGSELAYPFLRAAEAALTPDQAARARRIADQTLEPAP
jgi:hypothetical protein